MSLNLRLFCAPGCFSAHSDLRTHFWLHVRVLACRLIEPVWPFIGFIRKAAAC